MSDEVEALTEYLVRECQWCEEDAHHRIDAALILARWPSVGKLACQRDSARAWAVELEQQVALLSWLHAEARWLATQYAYELSGAPFTADGRVWLKGDPEPDEGVRLRDAVGDEWTKGGGGWHLHWTDGSPSDAAVAWEDVLSHGPLTEVPS